MSLPEEVKAGRLRGLVALRDALAKEIEDGPRIPDGFRGSVSSQTASLARQLRDVLKEIEVIEASMPKGSQVDELEGKRADRRAKTSGGSPSRRRGVVGGGGGS